jgi:hypothetical protein
VRVFRRDELLGRLELRRLFVQGIAELGEDGADDLAARVGLDCSFAFERAARLVVQERGGAPSNLKEKSPGR